MAKLDAFFKLMFDTGASDLHIVSGQPPILRVHGDLERVKYDPLDDEHLRQMLYEIAPEQKIKTFEETGDVDFGYEIPNVARFRANYFMQKYGCGAVFRQIPTKILTADELGLPPILKKSAMLHKGLVLVTGPTGSGKSTTLAAVVDHANKHRKDHIVTIEDPIEFVHQAQGCLVNHREVGIHTRSFAAALRGALREDPDIILVGEMRDLETIRLALEAANTGHLVFGTLHTTSASKTIDRVIEVFPAVDRSQGRRRPEPVQARRQEGPVRGAGDPGVHGGRRQPDPRGQDGPDPLGDPDREAVRHADARRRDHGRPVEGLDQSGRGLRQVQRQDQVPAAAQEPAGRAEPVGGAA